MKELSPMWEAMYEFTRPTATLYRIPHVPHTDSSTTTTTHKGSTVTTAQTKTEVNDWTKGVKFDGAKPRMDLLDPEFLEHVAQVLTFGAQKYDAHNWRQGITVSRLIGAAYRHLGAINKGEDLDPESGLPHAAHLGCCVMFLDWHLTHRPELDDRYKHER